MRKFTLNLSRFAALLAILFVGVGSALAQTKDNPVDLGEMELNKTYETKWGGYYTGWFTSPVDGTMYTCAGLEFSTSSDFSSLVPDNWSGYGEKAYYYNLKANTVYYMRCADWTGVQNSSITLFMDGIAGNDLKIVNCKPAIGGVYSSANGETVNIEFSSPMASGVKGSIITPDGSTTTAGIQVSSYSTFLDVNLATAVDRLLASGKLKKGDKFTLKLTGVKTAGGVAYDGTGIVELEFISAGKSVTLVSNTVPTEFLSYYVPDSPAGIFTLTFDGDLSTTKLPNVSLSFGNIDNDVNGGYYHESIPCTVDGNVLSINVTGKSRRVTEMIGTNPASQYMTLQVSGVRDADGNYVASTGAGTIGSYTFAMTYKEVERVNVMGDFTPANGTSLNGVEKLEIWVNGVEAIDFSGVKFEYVDADGSVKSVIVPRSEVAYEPENATSGVFTVTIPAEVKGKKNVKVTFADLVANDGYDHQFDIMAEYDGLVIVHSDPANGSEMANVAEGTVMTVDFNYAEQYPNMYVEYEIHDLNATNPDLEIVKAYTFMMRQDNGSYTSEFMQPLKLMRDHSYSVVFTAWESEALKYEGKPALGTTTLTWYGLTEPMKTSVTKFVKITPDTETVLTAEDNVMTVEFDGLVKIDPADARIVEGQGLTLPFESVVPVDGVEDEEAGMVSNIWKLTISPDYMKTLDAQLVFSFQAYDVMGDLVVPEDEENPTEESCFIFTYKMAAMYKDFDTDPANNSDVASVSKIVVSSELGIGESYLTPVTDVVVMSMFGSQVAKVVSVEMPDVELGKTATEMSLILDKEITDEGTYMVNFPAGLFVIGDGEVTYQSAEKMIRFSVVKPAVPMAYTTDPAEGDVVSLSKVTLTFTEGLAGDGIARSWDGSNATLTLPGGEVVNIDNVEPTSVDPDNWDIPFNMLEIVLPETYTAVGAYKITIPAGYLINGMDNYDNEIVLNYTIGQSGISNIVAPVNGVYEVYNLMGVRVAVVETAAELNQLPAGIYIVNGVKYAVR